MVKIVDEREIGEYLANLLGAKKNNVIIPIPATIKDIKKQDETGNMMILVQFGPGIAGKMYVPANIKIEVPFAEELEKIENEVSGKMNPIWIFLILLIVLFIFIYLTIFFGK